MPDSMLTYTLVWASSRGNCSRKFSAQPELPPTLCLHSRCAHYCLILHVCNKTASSTSLSPSWHERSYYVKMKKTLLASTAPWVSLLLLYCLGPAYAEGRWPWRWELKPPSLLLVPSAVLLMSPPPCMDFSLGRLEQHMVSMQGLTALFIRGIENICCYQFTNPIFFLSRNSCGFKLNVCK